jgi:hypothetical protein
MTKASATFKAGGARARRTALLAASLLAALSGPLRAAPPTAPPFTAAVFPFELDDTSLDGAMRGVQPAEQARLHALDAQLRAALDASGRYTLLDIAPVAAKAAAGSLRSCESCGPALAQQLGAQVEVNGWVQKVSNLILNINVVVRDTASGRVIDAGSADIRGNTDESWQRGLAWLLRHRILVAGQMP